MLQWAQVRRNGIKVKGTCRLCGNFGKLRRSHVLPAFLFRWLRKSSASGHMRFGGAPNRRVQDGWKKRWLCSNCEGRLGTAERQFAQRIFQPLVEDRIVQTRYGPWMLKFCVSVTWRVLLHFREVDRFDDYSRSDHKLLDQTATVWRDYLLGRVQDLGHFRQHIYIVKGVSSARRRVASNINQHVLRHIDADIVQSKHQHIVYAKLPRLFVMGVLRDERPNDWQGTEVRAGRGCIPPGQEVPDEFFDYVNEKAERADTRLASMSDRQKAKVLEAVLTDPARVADSDTIKALGLDAALGYLQEAARRE